jgi:hypothetical protein
MSLLVGGNSGGNNKGRAVLPLGTVSLPGRPVTPLTARQLNPTATIVAAVREGGNRKLLRQSGADRVVVSSDAAGQMLAISTVRPAAGMVINDLLERGRAWTSSSGRPGNQSWAPRRRMPPGP